MKLQKLEDITQENMLVTIYGNSGVGKTQLASTFPKPLLLIDCGDRKYGHITENNVVVANAETYAEVMNLLSHEDTIKQYKTIVIDNLSGLMTYARQSHAPNKRTLTQQDWQNVNYLLMEAVTRIKQISQDRICVLIGHQKVYEAHDGDMSIIESITINSNPALKGWIEPNTNVAIHVRKYTKEADIDDLGSKQEVAFGAVVSPQTHYWTNGQGLKNVPQGIVENPTYEKIFNYKGENR